MNLNVQKVATKAFHILLWTVLAAAVAGVVRFALVAYCGGLS